MEAAERLERRRLHLEELPIAGLLSWHANKERDEKKKPEPFEPQDFFWWSEPKEDPPELIAAGAAMLQLIRQERFGGQFHGPWSDELEKAGAKGTAPARLAWIAPDAILLAPVPVGPDRWRGYLIAMAESSGQVRTFTAPTGESVRLHVPATVGAEGEVEADPQACLPIAQ